MSLFVGSSDLKPCFPVNCVKVWLLDLCLLLSAYQASHRVSALKKRTKQLLDNLDKQKEKAGRCFVLAMAFVHQQMSICDDGFPSPGSGVSGSEQAERTISIRGPLAAADACPPMWTFGSDLG